MKAKKAPKRDSGGSHKTAASWFGKLAAKTAHVTGKPGTFLLAVAVVVVWGVSGPLFNYSDTWQLVINTGTTIVTFLMVFLIQATQNRDTLALQLKLDELIVATKAAHNEMAGIEEEDEKALDEAKKRVLARSREAVEAGYLPDPPVAQKKRGKSAKK
jgi:low affinity Fe/Cu permease